MYIKTYKAGKNSFPAWKLANSSETNGSPAYKWNSCEFLHHENSLFFFFFLNLSSSRIYVLPCWYHWSLLLEQLIFLATGKKFILHKSQYFVGVSQIPHWNDSPKAKTTLSTPTTANKHGSSIYTRKCHITRHWTCIKVSFLPYFQGKGVFAIRHSEIQQTFQNSEFFFVSIPEQLLNGQQSSCSRGCY